MPQVFERYEDREQRLHLEQEQMQAARVTRQEQARAFRRLVHFRDATLLTQQEGHPLLYPKDRPDVLAARQQYLELTERSGNPPNPRLLTQVDAELRAMSGEMTKDDVHFLAYDLNRAQTVQGTTQYTAARRMFMRILRDVRDLPRLRQEAAQRQSNKMKFQAAMEMSKTHHGGPGPWRLPPVTPW